VYYINFLTFVIIVLNPHLSRCEPGPGGGWVTGGVVSHADCGHGAREQGRPAARADA